MSPNPTEGVVTCYRLLQTGVEDVIYARAISKIQKFYSEIDPTHAGLFEATAVDQVGTLAAAAIAAAFLSHQWTTWMHVAQAMPMAKD